MAAILVIDPSPSVRETLRIVLGSEHAVALAPSWDDVASRTTAPDLVIFGAPPPPRDDAAIGAARARVAGDAPVLLLNAPAEVNRLSLAPAGHRVAFLPKPLDAARLRTAVRALLAPLSAGAPTATTVARHRRWLEPPLLTPAAAALARRATLTDVAVLLVGDHGTGALDVAHAIHFFSGAVGRVVARSARAITTRLLPDDDALDPAGALVIDDVHLLSPDGHHTLLAHLRSPDANATLRVFAITDVELDAYVAGGTFAPELAYALSVLPILLTPLRERGAEIPALVEALAPPITIRLRLEPVTFTAAAIARLTQYLWYGNVAELEAVLTRTLAVHRARVVEPDMLLFTAADAARAVTAPVDAASVAPVALPAAAPTVAAPSMGAPTVSASSEAPPPEPSGTAPPGAGDAPSPAPPDTSSASPPAASAATLAPSPFATSGGARGRVLPLERRRSDDSPAAGGERPSNAGTAERRPPAPPVSRADAADSVPAGSGPTLEVLLGELAHELRNPMVTIKTFAQHLDHVLDDPEVRARFSSLASDAITRMDTLLETLLDFSRFRTPQRQRVDLAALLARALDEHADDLVRKGTRIEHDAAAQASTLVEADEAQMLFALRCLVNGLVVDLVPRTPIRIGAGAAGALELTVHTDRAIAARLAAYVESEEGGESTAVPLAFALATALIRRNAGQLEIGAGDDGATIITVTMPRAGIIAER